jgi:hypothetical protein
MSAMGQLVFEVQEFLDNQVGSSNQQILEQFDQQYQDDDRYTYMRSIVEDRISSRQLLNG